MILSRLSHVQPKFHQLSCQFRPTNSFSIARVYPMGWNPVASSAAKFTDMGPVVVVVVVLPEAGGSCSRKLNCDGISAPIVRSRLGEYPCCCWVDDIGVRAKPVESLTSCPSWEYCKALAREAVRFSWIIFEMRFRALTALEMGINSDWSDVACSRILPSFSRAMMSSLQSSGLGQERTW